MPAVVVIGQIARDLVLVVDDAPGAGEAVPVRQRREMLGGKGANQAVALAQLGMPVALVGVVGADETGDRMLEQARRDRVDVSAVTRRSGAATGLIADIVDRRGRWRYLEDLPPPVLLTAADIGRATAAGLFGAAGWASVQLQQPPDAVREAVRQARAAGCRVVLDGVSAADGNRDELLAAADVVRADSREAGLLMGGPVEDAGTALTACRELLRRGPSVVALGAGGDGNAFAWRDGHVVLPLLDVPVADTTGAGDALTAALVAALARGDRPEHAAWLAVAAAAATAGHPGGRPDLSPAALHRMLDLMPERG